MFDKRADQIIELSNLDVITGGQGRTGWIDLTYAELFRKLTGMDTILVVYCDTRHDTKTGNFFTCFWRKVAVCSILYNEISPRNI